MASIELTTNIEATSGSGSAVINVSSNASLEGDLPSLSFDGFARTPTQIAVNLPDLRFSGDFLIWANLDGVLPPLDMEGDFGKEGWLDSSLPGLTFSGHGNALMPAGTLPALSFDGEVKPTTSVNVAGKLPVLSFDGSFGAQPGGDWTLPALSFDGLMSAFEQDNYGAISGTLPALARPDSFTYHDEQDLNLSASFSPLSFSGEIKVQITGTLTGTLPQISLTGEIESQDGWALSGKLPDLQIDGSITGDDRFEIAGTLPALSTPPSGSVGRVAPATTAEDVSTTGDDVIRHRRWA